MESRSAIRQEVRRLQPRVPPVAQPGVILQDLRIATILNELNAVNALSLSRVVRQVR